MDKVSERVYKTNFLTNVILRVDFPKVLSLDREHPPADFHAKIKEWFPDVRELPGGVFQIELKGNADGGPKVSTQEAMAWVFSNKDKTKTVTVQSEAIAIEFSKYKDFEEFSGVAKSVFDVFFNIYDVVNVYKRVGLRFIDQIRVNTGNALDWDNMINPALVAISRDFVRGTVPIKRSMHLLEIKDEGCDLRFQFGLFNSEYPNPIARKEFVLDYDCSWTDETEISDIFGKVKTFHKIILKWFEMSIGDELRRIMDGEAKNG